MTEDYPHEEPGLDSHERAIFRHDKHRCQRCHQEYQPHNRIEARRNHCTPCHLIMMSMPSVKAARERAKEEKRINQEAEKQLKRIEREQIRATKALEKVKLRDMAKVEKARVKQLSKLEA